MNKRNGHYTKLMYIKRMTIIIDLIYFGMRQYSGSLEKVMESNSKFIESFKKFGSY